MHVLQDDRPLHVPASGPDTRPHISGYHSTVSVYTEDNTEVKKMVVEFKSVLSNLLCPSVANSELYQSLCVPVAYLWMQGTILPFF